MLYCQETTCVGPGWVEIHRVKGHLHRRHALPPQCPRCWEVFATDNLRDTHLQNDPPCPKPENDTPLDGFTPAHRKKTDTNMTDAGKWREIYTILFPDDDAATIPNPYHEEVDFGQCGQSGSNTPTNFAGFVRREFLRLVRHELDILFQSEFQDVEERLRPRVRDIVFRLQTRIITIYERETMKTRPSREGGIGSPAVSGLIGEMEERAEPEQATVGQATMQMLTRAPRVSNFNDELAPVPWGGGPLPSKSALFEFNFDWSAPLDGLFNDPALNQFTSSQQDMWRWDGMPVT
ncbi:hypothetical protein QBC33DRAFT_501962 [Phialemonium atrogriseum]|uniref:C2H2-type domain-containing protein n=1 Tax=Phialemonium atrogriseum TaxID=1093897 RepID=A0AAJ0FIE8_9PEZI|nr:uncharacterized protein QBC33DRAFT_501962 [Phialemonium atrogriseum]KAK1762030.1 hypothetical protein QBC33DRAFT_501962 [Phialemonium atrogriseum]